MIEPWNGGNDMIIKNSGIFFKVVMKEIPVRRLRLTGRAWRKQGSLIKTVIENNPADKRPSGKTSPQDGTIVLSSKDVGDSEAGILRKEAVKGGQRWTEEVEVVWNAQEGGSGVAKEIPFRRMRQLSYL